MQYRILMIAPTSFFSDYGGHIRILEEARILRKAAMSSRCDVLQGPQCGRVGHCPDAAHAWHADYEVGSSRHKFAFDALLSGTASRRRCVPPGRDPRTCTKARSSAPSYPG